MLHRPIPSTEESLPAIGLGTWKTFNVTAQAECDNLKEVLLSMHNSGGTLIDTSPMYGHAERTVGVVSQSTHIADNFFYATKVWTTGKQQGIQQMEESLRSMQRKQIDLMQIHNLVDWKTHLQTLQQWKKEGKIRYIGITHYTDAMHDELVKIIAAEKIDFVQFNYSIISRNAEKKLLPAAIDHGVATLINRPLSEGNLFSKVKGKKLPSWAAEHDIHSWSSYFLKYILAHHGVTCVIPATSNMHHLKDNLKAGEGALPDEKLRKRMMEYIITS
jgi:diketogulonate reductase-like aldo/keto reductase